MRKKFMKFTKFILVRFVPILIILPTFFILVVFLIKNDLNANSVFVRRFSSPRGDHVNHTTLFKSLNLTKANLAQHGYLCESASGNVFVGLISKASMFQRRSLIRETLAKQVNESNQKILFFVGKSRDETVNERLDKEFATSQDIVRLEFIEDYHNLTLKTLAFLEYFNEYCNNFKFAIKLDDDVFLNWHGILGFLRDKEAEERPTIYCNVYVGGVPIRDRNSKWFMDRKNYPAPVYPNFCGGRSYILNRNAVKKVLEQHEKVKKKRLLYLEDVYATGICTVGSETRLIPEAKFLDKSGKSYFLQNYLNHTILVIHPIIDKEYRNLYQQVKNLKNL